jgi:tetratricopeptide (TPR) repeat protein
VAKKHKRHRPAAVSTAELRRRVERARDEGRFQTALDLAKQLHKDEPTPDHRRLLEEAYLGRARQLRAQGHTRDAQTVLEAAVHLADGSPAWLEQLAEELTHSGSIAAALALVQKLPDPAAADRLLPHVADAAFEQGPSGRALLPAALQADFDRVQEAFRQVEAGEDDPARQTLQGIGLRSPYSEWKLLLRGLQAYYQNDDARAVENWQRLSPNRVPARLAAPFRFQIDRPFRAAQSPAAQAVLQKQLDRLQDSPLLAQLRLLRSTLASPEGSASAFRQVETLLPTLRQEAPHLVPRLAACFYWSIIDSGPDSIPRYRRVFGNPPEDPNFHRLQALAYERAGELQEAHQNWLAYTKDIAAHPEAWPGDQARHARALVWLHMGRNAAHAPDTGPRPRGLRLLDWDEPGPLNPPAEKCFKESLTLEPTQLEAHEALFRYHLDGGRLAKAEKAGQQLLKHFPDHVPTLQQMSTVCEQRGKPAEALELARRALQANPIDRRLRARVGGAHLALARGHTEAGRFDEARTQFQAALPLAGSTPDVLCSWAGCEFKAGDTARAEELLAQARSSAPTPLGIAYRMTAEVGRLKLERALKKRFEDELQAGLRAAPDPAAVADLARIQASFDAEGINYVGSKGHAKKVLSYVNKGRKQGLSEQQFEDVCRALLDVGAYPTLRTFARDAEFRYPENPFFPYYSASAYVLAPTRTTSPWSARQMLENAERLARARSQEEKYRRLLEDIEKRREELAEQAPFVMGGFMDRMFENLFGSDDDYDDDDDWEDDTDGW